MVSATAEIHSLLEGSGFPLTHFEIGDDVVAHASSRRVSLYFCRGTMQEFLHRVPHANESVRKAENMPGAKAEERVVGAKDFVSGRLSAIRACGYAA